MKVVCAIIDCLFYFQLIDFIFSFVMNKIKLMVGRLSGFQFLSLVLTK